MSNTGEVRILEDAMESPIRNPGPPELFVERITGHFNPSNQNYVDAIITFGSRVGSGTSKGTSESTDVTITVGNDKIPVGGERTKSTGTSKEKSTSIGPPTSQPVRFRLYLTPAQQPKPKPEPESEAKPEPKIPLPKQSYVCVVGLKKAFASGKSDVPDEEVSELNDWYQRHLPENVKQALKRGDGLADVVEIVGYTDDREKRAYNIELGAERANSVLKWFGRIAGTKALERVTARSGGEGVRPNDDPKTETDDPKRRVVIITVPDVRESTR